MTLNYNYYVMLFVLGFLIKMSKNPVFRQMETLQDLPKLLFGNSVRTLISKSTSTHICITDFNPVHLNIMYSRAH